MATPSSRVIVKGLPPSLKEPEIRAHFAARFAVTDLRAFPARRICFIGFESSEHAQRAIKYFHKSFMRMSRITVEPVDETLIQNTVRGPHSRKTVEPNASIEKGRSSLKRKRDHESPVPLGVNHSDSFANSIDTESQTKRTESSSIDNKRDEKTSVSQQESAQFQLGHHENVDHLYDADASLKPSIISNDGDWMRSRTSRLLGLIDEDDGISSANDQDVQPLDSTREEKTAMNLMSGQRSPTSMHEPLNKPKLSRSLDNESPEKDLTDNDTGRLFVRNLPFTLKEDDLENLFSRYGELSEFTIPRNLTTGSSKGIAFVGYATAEDATEALKHLDGTIFQGRLLHLLHAREKKDKSMDEWTIAQLPLKKQKLVKRKAQMSNFFTWNSLFMNIDAVVASVAARLQISKAELLDPSASDAAIKQAQAETFVIRETKEYFQSQGVNLSSLVSKNRDGNGLLIKNFPYGTTSAELIALLSGKSYVKRVLMPPAGTIAIMEFETSVQARLARDSLAYSKFKGSILYPEQGPADLFKPATNDEKDKPEDEVKTKDFVQENEVVSLRTSTLFVRNLNFATTKERLGEFFAPVEGFLSARVKTKQDAKGDGRILSMGFGFAEFRSKDQAHAATLALNGQVLDGHKLEIKESKSSLDAAEEGKELQREKRREGRKAKLIIKNLPFEISKKELRELIKQHGQVRSVRLPKKFDNSRKGFAFAEFTSPREAETAMLALQNTHLLGRRLVIDFASGEVEDPEAEIAKMQQKVDSQAQAVALQRLTASERRKFVLDQDSELPDEG